MSEARCAICGGRTALWFEDDRCWCFDDDQLARRLAKAEGVAPWHMLQEDVRNAYRAEARRQSSVDGGIASEPRSETAKGSFRHADAPPFIEHKRSAGLLPEVPESWYAPNSVPLPLPPPHCHASQPCPTPDMCRDFDECCWPKEAV